MYPENGVAAPVDGEVAWKHWPFTKILGMGCVGSLPLYFPSSLSLCKVSLSHSFLTVSLAPNGRSHVYSLLLPHCSKESPLSRTSSPRPHRRGLIIGCLAHYLDIIHGCTNRRLANMYSQIYITLYIVIKKAVWLATEWYWLTVLHETVLVLCLFLPGSVLVRVFLSIDSAAQCEIVLSWYIWAQVSALSQCAVRVGDDGVVECHGNIKK